MERRFPDRTAESLGAGMYTMHGSTSGSSYGAFYEGTYDLYLNENNTSALQPLVNASVYRSRMDGFTESGGLGMNVDDMDSTFGTVGLGARLRGELSANLTGRASWVNCGCRLSSFWATGTPQPSWHPPAYPAQGSA